MIRYRGLDSTQIRDIDKGGLHAQPAEHLLEQVANAAIKRLAGDDVIAGGPGNDWIYSSHGRNNIWAGAGNDHIWGHFGHGTIDCGSGWDVVHTKRHSTYKLRHCERHLIH